jgi:excisionase family DNA binding protein
MFKPQEDRLMTCIQVADALGLKPVTIRQWIAKRKIASVKVGDRAIRVHSAEVEKLVERGYTPARPEERGR